MATTSLPVPETNTRARRLLRVSVVEDDPTLRLFLQKLIQRKENDFECAGTYESAEAAVSLVKVKPDVVVVDLELPGVSGMEMIKHLSPHMPSTAFVVLTVHDDPKKVFAALRSGAHGYMLKTARPAEIAAGIRQASEGGAPLSQDIAYLYPVAMPVEPQGGWDALRTEVAQQVITLADAEDLPAHGDAVKQRFAALRAQS